MMKSELAFFDVLLLRWLLFGALFGFAGVAFIAEANANVESQMVFAPLWILTYILVLARWGIALPDRFSGSILALSFVASWLSFHPTTAFIYWLQLLASVAVFTSAIKKFETVDILSAIADAISIMLVASLLLYFAQIKGSAVLNDLSRENWLGMPPIAGLFSHKIYLAIAAALLMILSLLGRWKINYFRLFLAGFCLSLTQSMSVVLILAFLLPLGFLLQNLRRSYGAKSVLILPGLVGTLIVGGLIFVPLIAQYFGRDWSGLTGRWQIWETVFARLSDMSLFGLGYENATRDPKLVSAFRITFSHNYLPPHLHNSYVQHFVNIGVIGFGAFILMLAAAHHQAMRRFFGPSETGICVWLVLIFFSILGFVEHVFTHNHIGLFWLLLALNGAQPVAARATKISPPQATNQQQKSW